MVLSAFLAPTGRPRQREPLLQQLMSDDDEERRRHHWITTATHGGPEAPQSYAISDHRHQRPSASSAFPPHRVHDQQRCWWIKSRGSGWYIQVESPQLKVPQHTRTAGTDPTPATPGFTGQSLYLA